MVRTQDFHSCNRGSIPRSATNLQFIENSFTRKGNFFMTTNLLNSFFEYLKSPKKYLLKTDKQGDKISIKEKIWNTIQIISLIIWSSFVLVNLSSFVSSLVGFNQLSDSTVSEFLTSNPVWLAFLLVSIFGPLTEELGFRLFLSKNKNWFFLGLAAFGYFMIQFIFDLFLDLSDPSLVVSIGFFVALFVWFLTLIILNFRFTKEQISNWVSKYFNYISWFSIVSFGLFHVTNYLSFWQYFYLIPLLISPQFVAGIFLSFIRTKLGFLWAFILHGSYNFVLSLSIFADPNNVAVMNLVNSVYLGLLLVLIFTILQFILVKLRVEIVE